MEIVFCYNINETDISQKNVVILFFFKGGCKIILAKKSMNKYLKKAIPLAVLSSFLSLNTSMASPSELDSIAITAEFKDTSLVDTLDALSKLSNIPMIIHGDLKAKVTMNTNGQSLLTILNNISRAFDLSYEDKDGMIIFSTKDAMKKMHTFHLNYLDLEDAKASLKTLFEEDDIAISTMDNTITVSGSEANIGKAMELIKDRDRQQKQVSIQARLVELTKDEQEKLGLKHEWNGIHDTTSKINKGWYFDLGTTLTAEAMENSGNVIARPTISTMNGKEAEINITDQVPILTTTTSNNDKTTTVDYKEVGIILKVTPRINEDTGYVTMQVDSTTSTITGYVTNNNVSAPQTSSRQAKTTLRAKSGDTIIIGGLLKKEDIMSISKIPILGDIPIFGKLLFQYKNHDRKDTELVIMLTPIIEDDAGALINIKNENLNNDRLHDLHNDKTKQELSQKSRVDYKHEEMDKDRKEDKRTKENMEKREKENKKATMNESNSGTFYVPAS